MQPLPEKFGERVRLLRKSRGLSQEKLAELANLHSTYISGIECGARNVSLINIGKIAEALKINLEELFKGF
jgi:transcriptional regulator with XRE-family HTH domain